MIAEALPFPSRKERIAASFAAAAASYERSAKVQRLVAQRLAARVLEDPPPPGARILEVGCGTGLLSRLLVPALPGRRWLVTDLAGPMLDRCRAVVGKEPGVEYRVMDGERPDLPPSSQDWIVSSLAFQWFDDLAHGIEALAACLRPGGRLLFSTVGRETFQEWRRWLTSRAGAEASGLGEQPDAASLSRVARVVGEERIPLDLGGGAAFLRHLKELGAGVAAHGYRPLSPAILREAMRTFDGRVSYHVLYGEVRAGAEQTMERPFAQSAC